MRFWEIGLQSFLFLLFWIWQAAEHTEFRGGGGGGGVKCLKISQKLHGGDRKHIKVCKKTKISKLTDELFFTPMPTSIVRISKQSCATCSPLCWSALHIMTLSLHHQFCNSFQMAYLKLQTISLVKRRENYLPFSYRRRKHMFMT